MGNSVSAHIYETKVFRPYPVILYRLRLDPSIHWWKKIGVPRNNQIWRTREIVFLLISTKLSGKVTVHL